MLKTTQLSDKPSLSRNDGSRLASNKNYSSKPAFKKKNSNNEVGFDNDSIEYTNKLKKSKSQNLAKFQKLSKSKKLKSEKLLKDKNLPHFNITEAGSSFLTFDARTAFNCL